MEERVTIKNINKRIGFNIKDYLPEISSFEDDRKKENDPLDLLSVKELRCMIAFNRRRSGLSYKWLGFTDEDLEP